MRVTHRTPETLIVEDGSDLLVGLICLGLGSLGVLIGVTQGWPPNVRPQPNAASREFVLFAR